MTTNTAVSFANRGRNLILLFFFLAHIFTDHVIIPANNEREFTAHNFFQELLTIIMHQLKIPWNI